jgi:hypothetical protein
LAAGSGPIADQRVRRGVAATGKAGLRQVAPHPDTTQGGWVAGGGFEWMITNNWLLRGEYLYYSLNVSPLRCRELPRDPFGLLLEQHECERGAGGFELQVLIAPAHAKVESAG